MITAIASSGVSNATPTGPQTLYGRCGTLAGESTWYPQFTQDHTHLAVLTNAGTVRLIATEGFREIAELSSGTGRIEAAAFSPDGALLATLSHEAGQLALWSTRDGSLQRLERLGAVLAIERWGAAVTFSSDGRYVATTLQSVTDLQRGTTTRFAGARLGYRLWFAEGTRRLVVYGYDQVGSNLNLKLFYVELDTGATVLLRLAPGAMAHSEDGRFVALESSGKVDVFDLRQPTPVPVPLAGQGVPLAFAPDSSRVYLRQGGEITGYDPVSGSSGVRFPLPQEARFLGLSPRGELIGASTTETRWWDPSTGGVVRAVPEVLRQVVYARDGQLGASASTHSLLHVWDEASGADLLRIAAPTRALPRLNARLNLREQLRRPRVVRTMWPVTASWNGEVSIWRVPEIRDASFLRVYDRAGSARHTFSVNGGSSAELSADGEVIFTVEGEGPDNANRYVPIWCATAGVLAQPQASAVVPGPTPARSPGTEVASAAAPIGEFSVELAHPVRTPHDARASVTAYTTLRGAVYRGPRPRSAFTVRATSGACTLLSPRTPHCDACAAPDVCVDDGVCVTPPAPLRVGTVAVRGVKSVTGEDALAMHTAAHHYLRPGDRELAYPAFEEGAPISLASTGGELEPFVISGTGVAPMSMSEETLRISRGEPLVLRWAPPRSPAATRVRLEIDLSPWVGARDVIACEAEDSGELSVPAELIEEAARLGLSGYPTLNIERFSTTSVQTSAGRVDLKIHASHEHTLWFHGVGSCYQTPEFCGDGHFKFCRTDKFCEFRDPEAQRAVPKEPPSFWGLLGPAEPDTFDDWRWR